MTMWCRHAGDSRWHTGRPDSHSFVTLCDGRWSLADRDAVELATNPPIAERCELCVKRHAAIEAERTEVHGLVDYLCMAANEREGCPPIMGTAVAKLARELRRLRVELEERTNDLHVVERELAQQHEFERALAPLGVVTALIEALSIAQSAGRRGLLSAREHQRLRELAKVVPQ